MGLALMAEPPRVGAPRRTIDKRWFILAVLGSFCVYLLPLLSVHITMPWGVALWMEVFRYAEDRGAAWLALDIGFAALVQLAAGGLIYWTVRRWHWGRGLLLVALVPVFLAVVNAGYLYGIPTLILVEREPGEAHGDWAVACAVADAEVAPMEYGPTATLESASEAWIVIEGERYGLLTPAGCTVRDLPISIFRTTVAQVIPGGGALYRTSDPQTGVESIFVLPPGGAPVPLEKPATDGYWHPILAADALAVAWISREPGQDGRGVGWSIHLRPIGAPEEPKIDLRMDRPASIELIAFDRLDGRFLARRNGKEIVTIDGDGRIAPEPQAPDIAIHPTQRYRKIGAGWVSWEIYRDRGRHRLVWSLPAGEGVHELPLGRGIGHVSVSPDGQMIAIGVGLNLSIGSVKDSVYVLRASDGVEIFRRFFPPYTRSRPAFLGNRYFALTTVEAGAISIEVLEVPGG